jgi:hypothetical protein
MLGTHGVRRRGQIPKGRVERLIEADRGLEVGQSVARACFSEVDIVRFFAFCAISHTFY